MPQLNSSVCFMLRRRKGATTSLRDPLSIRAYLRASTKDQDASHAKHDLHRFVEERKLKIAVIYLETESRASLKRPELFRLLEDCHPGNV